jgi:hypothetical protein
MTKRLLIGTASLLFAAGLALAQGDAKMITGVVTDTMCGASHGDGTDARTCTQTCVKEHGAKLALYDKTSKKVYVLDPQAKATGHEGHTVTITGTVDSDGKTLHIDALKMVSAKPTGL